MLINNILLRFFAPHDCLACGVEGRILCGWCRFESLGALPSRCYRCRKQTTDFAVCQACRRQTRLKHVWVTTEYGGINKALIYKLKFARAQEAAGIVAEVMAEALPNLPRNTLVSFVPTASSRRRLRGYDQSELIACKLASLTGLEFCSLLARSGQSRQVGAKRETRKRQLNKAFRARTPGRADGVSVLLVDDITTTGATLEAAAIVLRQAGAKHVNAAVFAQKR